MVGIRCRNKWYVEVQVGGRWTKAEIGQFNVQYGERRKVQRVWVSGDGRDAEYTFVGGAMQPPPEPEPVIQPIAEEPVMETEEPVEVAAGGPDENPSAYDFMEKARMEAYQEYMR